MSPTIRRATPEDIQACAQICYDAFYKINTDHNFPPEIPSVDFANMILGMMFSHPGFYCVVAEADGQILGSNCMDERSPISGIGPITIDPNVQNGGVGRSLMNAVLDRARERNVPSVRLVQAAFHNRSLSLYTKLGFDPREPLSCMQGPAIGKTMGDCQVRPATEADLFECNRLCAQIHGIHRGGDLAESIGRGAVVVERQGRIAGYSTVLGFFGHSIAESMEDLQALIASAEKFEGPGILVPTRNAELFRWCLENGLRVVEPLTLMTLGYYAEPSGAYLPSILY